MYQGLTTQAIRAVAVNFHRLERAEAERRAAEEDAYTAAFDRLERAERRRPIKRYPNLDEAQNLLVHQYLLDNGYTSVEEWAVDSDYSTEPSLPGVRPFTLRDGEWYDDNGIPREPVEALVEIIQEGGTYAYTAAFDRLADED